MVRYFRLYTLLILMLLTLLGSVACTERVPIGPTGPSQSTNPASTTPTGPVARDDSYTMQRGTVLRVPAPGLLANDSLPPGITGSVRVVQPMQITFSLSNDGGTGGFTADFSRNPDFTGRVSFQYEIVSSIGNSNPATVTITVQ